MTRTAIARSFSEGRFTDHFERLSASVEWEIIGDGEARLTGKDAVERYCREVGAYFDSVTTEFRTANVIEQDDQVCVNGTARFLRDGNLLNFVRSCDLYEFDSTGKIARITSYCVARRD